MLAGNRFELVIEMGNIIIPARIAYFRHIAFIFHQQPACSADPYLHQKTNIGFIRPAFKIPAKRLPGHVQQLRNIVNRDLFAVPAEGMIKYQLDTLPVCIVMQLHKPF
jgi:hypothetical protein